MHQEKQRIHVQLFWSLVVIAGACCATGILYRLDPSLRQRGNFAFFLAAIAIAAWRGGIISALFTVVLASFVVAWLMPPANSFRITNPEDVVRLVIFIGLGLLISYLQHARYQAEESLHESNRRLRFSLDSSGVACWDADVKNGTFWKSHNLPTVYGRTDSDFATTYEGFFAYVHPEDREFFHLASVGGGRNYRDYEIAHRIICGDGSSRKVKTRGRMYVNDDGRVERMVGAVYSIDDLSAASDALNDLRRSESEISADML